MTILGKYLSKTVLQTIFLVLMVLVGLDLLITFVGELGEIGTGDYGVWQVFEYALLDMPLRVYFFFPMASLVGVLLGLGVLAGNSELIVMRASGLSIARISAIIMGTTFIVVLIITLMGETLGPYFKHIAEKRKITATSAGQVVHTKEGVWQRDSLNFIHIGRILPGEQLEDVTRYEFNDAHRLLSVTYAKQAIYKDKLWHLSNVKQTKFNEKSISSQNLSESELTIQLNPKLLRISQVLPQEMTLNQLHSYIKYRELNGLRSGQYGLAFWQRILQPLATCLMVLLAIPFIFGPLRSVTMGLRFVVGASVGFAFYMLNQFFGPMSLVYQIPPFFAAFLPTLLISFVATILIMRVK